MQALSRREENAVMDIARAEAEAACKDTLRGKVDLIVITHEFN